MRLCFILDANMVLYCCAFNCKEKYVKGGPYTFHGFSKGETRRKEWCRLLRNY
ncbi:unnamed protein product [Larinioides sclopetarius]|uniref:THAP-type domain-containing protein n=1 Tax=Larinioides sclopetarius TaxID=280406 RepID=A0AAV1ZLU8_9ARAC